MFSGRFLRLTYAPLPLSRLPLPARQTCGLFFFLHTCTSGAFQAKLCSIHGWTWNRVWRGRKVVPHFLSIQVSPRRVLGKLPSKYHQTRNKTKTAITKRPGVPILSGRRVFLLHWLGSRCLFMAVWGNVSEQSDGLLDLAAKFWPSVSVTFYAEIPFSPCSLTFAVSHLGGLLNRAHGLRSCARSHLLRFYRTTLVIYGFWRTRAKSLGLSLAEYGLGLL